MIRVGDGTGSVTSRTPVEVKPGRTASIKVGGEGRPVIGRFVPPAGYDGPFYLGAGLRALQTSHPDRPRPADYDQMTNRQKQEWLRAWWQTPEATAYSEQIWRNPNWRAYTFRIEDDGSFRVEDVIGGKYKMTVYLEEEPTREGRPEEIGGYSGTIEVPPMAQAYTDEPLDLGNLVLKMRKPLHVGDVAPLFEAKTLDGKDIRLIDHRGKFVLLSFWAPEYDPELNRLKELYTTYGATGKFQIIGLGGNDTLEEVKKYVAQHKIEWPEIYFGQKWDEGIAGQYGPYILLVDPEGKIIATWLRGEKLTNTVREAMRDAAHSS